MRSDLSSAAAGAHTDPGPLDPAQVRDRAILAMNLPFTIADATSPDLPLIWVNAAFSQLTGWSLPEVVGRNCRFLQGPDTDPAAVARIREALGEGRAVVQTLVNYRRDGTSFSNEVTISPVLDDRGAVLQFVGVQNDVTSRVALERASAEAYRLERVARESAESARAETTLVADVSAAMTRVDAREAMTEVTDLLAGHWGGWAAVYLSAQSCFRCVAASGGPTTPRLVGHLFARSRVPNSLLGSPGAAFLPLDLPEAWRIGGQERVAFAPLRVRGQTLGVLLLGTTSVGDDDAGYLQLVDAVSTRVAVALDITRLYEREHELAIKLQQAVLPDLPTVAGLDLHGHYVPSQDAASMGGDWYEVLRLRDGRVLVAIGDVEGHDVDAATTMGRLRSALQSYALQLHGPAALIGWLEQALTAMALPRLASVCVGLIDRPTAEGAGRLRWSAAGHPPSLLRRADGRVEVLDGAQGPLLGAQAGPYPEAETTFDAGDLLLMYTDGLIEHRSRSLGQGVALLGEHLARAHVAALPALWPALRGACPVGVEDDAAFLAVRAQQVAS